VTSMRGVAQLRAFLHEMEVELGLTDLPAIEKDVLYAIVETLEEVPSAARSETVRMNPLAAAIPQASYHRALRNLLAKGLIKRAPDTKAGRYILGDISK
jgi:predicted transcriptional regulator